jgi:hypothetical protein
MVDRNSMVYGYLVPCLMGCVVSYFTFLRGDFPDVFYVSGLRYVFEGEFYSAFVSVVEVFAFVGGVLVLLSILGMFLRLSGGSFLGDYVDFGVYLFYSVCSIGFFNFILIMSLFNPEGTVNYVVSSGLNVFLSVSITFFFVFSVLLVYGSVDATRESLGIGRE